MIDESKVYDFPSFYIEFAKLKPKDQKHIFMCLRNRQRTLQKEMGLCAAKQTESGNLGKVAPILP